MSPSEKGIVVKRGPLEVDVPRSAGYYGGIAVAVGIGMIEWPVAIFIGAIPLIKMLNRPELPRPVRFVGEVFDGAAKPVGGDAEGTIRLNRVPRPVRRVARGESPSAPARRRASTRRTRREAAPGGAGRRTPRRPTSGGQQAGTTGSAATS